MAIGVGKLMGFDLINNFNRPYLSQSITEFWRRWHISLSTWLRDYIYIPLGGNRCSRARNYLNIIITFFVSGIWHGANWTFIVWGLLHGLAQVIEKALGLNRIQSHGVVRTLRIIVTFFIVNAAWVFFRMQSLSDACQVMMRIITQPYGNIEYATPSMWLFILMGLGIIFIKDLMDEFSKPEHTLLNNKSIIVRWSTYLVLSTIILLCGVFDASQFIYVGF
jgi:D-alanyl-lipoteichoic acid acyltransferase DltB (MBOAT superfamily)